MPRPRCAESATVGLPKRTVLGYRGIGCHSGRQTFNERTGLPFDRLQIPTDDAQRDVLWHLRNQPSSCDLVVMFLIHSFYFTQRGCGIRA